MTIFIARVIPLRSPDKHRGNNYTRMIGILKMYSRPGVFSVVTGPKSVRVLASSNMLLSLNRILPELPDKVRITILDTSSNTKERSIMAGYYVGRYKKSGWAVESYYKPWKVRSRIVTLSQGEHAQYGKYKIALQLYNRHSVLTVGVFDGLDDLEAFRKQYYKGNRIHCIVCANNELTKTFIQKSIH